VSASVLVLNCGSATVKLALVDPATGNRELERLVDLDDRAHHDIVAELFAELSDAQRASIRGVGHRVVHGGTTFTESTVVDDDVLRTLRGVVELAPLHMPANLAGIEAARRAFPGRPQVAVFDTAFHQTMPPVAYRYAVPGEWYREHEVRRFGFHGTSHRYVSGRAADLLGRPLEALRMVTMHLGNGCSAAAIRGGRCIDTTMGLTPLEGLVMGTRSGDIDPGVLGHIAPRLGLDVAGVLDVLNTRSGLLGLSGRSGDMRELTAAAEAGDADAALAIDVFCYRAAKTVGALAVALGGLDVLVLTGGIGEHDVTARASILGRLGAVGLDVDPLRNDEVGGHGTGRISADGPVVALVVPTDEEWLIAQDTAALS
jgi:acetate kinase